MRYSALRCKIGETGPKQKTPLRTPLNGAQGRFVGARDGIRVTRNLREVLRIVGIPTCVGVEWRNTAVRVEVDWVVVENLWGFNPDS